MQTVETYTAQIFIGLRAGYTDKISDLSIVKAVCQHYVSGVGLCVTVTETEFIYSPSDSCPHYGEPGATVGLINYPRFPSTPLTIEAHAKKLARQLMAVLEQQRVSIVFQKTTVMLDRTSDL